MLSVSVSPSKYEKDLVIDPDTGVLTVMNALDSEEVASIHVHMKVIMSMLFICSMKKKKKTFLLAEQFDVVVISKIMF